MARTPTLSPALAAVLALASLQCDHRGRSHAPPPARVPLIGSVAVVPHAAVGNRLDCRPGDLVLAGSNGTTLVLAATPDQPGHQPVRGAIVDVNVPEPSGRVHVDPLVWWRSAWCDATSIHPLIADTVQSTRCANGDSGIRSAGRVGGVALETVACADRDGKYRITTTATSPMPDDAVLCDELNVGNAAVGLDAQGEHWSGTVQTRFLTVAERGLSFALEAPPMSVRRDDGPGRDELLRSVLWVRYPGGATTTRVIHLVPGDVFAALATLPIASHRVQLRGAAREFDLRDRFGTTLFQGELPATGRRELRLPPGLGDEVLFRDEHGVPAAGPVPIAGNDVLAPAIARTSVHLRYIDTTGRPIPVHVLFRGLAGTPDPEPRMQGHGYAGGRSVYLLDGSGDVALAPGHYRVTASHGPRYTLDVHEVALHAHGEADVNGELREVVETPDWISGDFHLHAAPSPDSHVSLHERVAALYCEGVDFAVATDHNRVTDYRPAMQQLGIDHALGTLAGEEVTTFTPYWGHFIAFPMPAGSSRSAGIVPFYDTTPARIFADARAHGAQVVQVNHGRMRPTMGYFDFTHLDPATGRADSSFANDFNSVEVFNGWYIEHPREVRRGAQDLVALVRRGLRPTATGNSDSHLLLFEEAGYPRTYVHAPREPMGAQSGRVIDGLLQGHTTISAGPFVEITAGGQGPGATVRPSGGGRLRVHVRVRAPAWVPVERVEVWVDDDVARTIAITTPAVDGVRFDDDVDLAIAHDSVVLAWADAQTPLPDVLPYAHAIGIGLTGLIYVDADGDGQINVPPRAPRPGDMPVTAPPQPRAMWK